VIPGGRGGPSEDKRVGPGKAEVQLTPGQRHGDIVQNDVKGCKWPM
jgi:hypothetical protein